MNTSKPIILLVVTILLTTFTIALPNVFDFNTDGIITSNSSHIFNYNFTIPTGEDLANVTWNWDGTNYSLYDDSLVLFYNFDNRSSLGEDDVTVKDLSKWGNNGTVYGGSNISWTSSGKYGGAFNFIPVSKINLSSKSLNFNDTISISFWVYSKIDMGYDIRLLERTIDKGGYSIQLKTGTGLLNFVIANTSSTSAGQLYSVSDLDYNKWTHLSFIYDNSTMFIYINGVLDAFGFKNSSKYNHGIGTSINIGNKADLSRTLNGSIDDLMVWNRSLNANEIKQLYNSQITKYDSQNWTFQNNQTDRLNLTLINSTISSYSDTYYLCFSNSTGSENCSSQKTITQIIPNKNLITNFTTSIGNVRNDFYGVNTHGTYFGGGTTIDKNGDGVLESLSNNSWNQNQFLNSKMNVLRIDTNLNSYANEDGTFSTSLILRADTVKWASQNGLKVLMIAGFTPEWLANKTSGWCTLSGSNSSCPPSNYSKWGDLVVSVIDNITSNGLYNSSVEVEVWNEPQSSGWLNNLTRDNIIKATEYIKLYNSTYLAIKAKYPNIPVGGPSSYIDSAPNMFSTFLSNMTTNMDFVTLHDYSTEDGPYGTDYPYFDDNIQIQSDELIANCSLYSANCSRIIFSEWNINEAITKNTTFNTNKYGMQIGLAYVGGLNNYPANVSMVIYQWSERYLENDSTNYPEYPQIWSMVVQPELIVTGQPQYKASYNVTKNFAHLCPAGGTVYASSSDDATIKTVSCKKGDEKNIIIINTDTESKNVTINLTDSGITTLYNYLNPAETYGTEVGIMDSYEILYLSNNNQVCGNGIKSEHEECDDGNFISGDGCSSSCLIDSASTDADLETSCTYINKFATNLVNNLPLIGTILGIILLVGLLISVLTNAVGWLTNKNVSYGFGNININHKISPKIVLGIAITLGLLTLMMIILLIFYSALCSL